MTKHRDVAATYTGDALDQSDVTTTADQQRRASLYVCGQAHDIADARLLLQALGLPPYDKPLRGPRDVLNVRQPWTESFGVEARARWQQADELIRQGATVAEAAKAVGVTRKTVVGYYRRAGVRVPEGAR